ncbi:hypothetical protein GA0116948_109168 [Chitinophaga costaii]|uniref:Uncharacterized protein n=1 Tax=Chitinophaga costaii TaxID=1335309 RepID=A0A1C4ESL4_9BACT|nr:hypothetical protein GA0116948_109168 [Chitinophaga costaii]
MKGGHNLPQKSRPRIRKAGFLKIVSIYTATLNSRSVSFKLVFKSVEALR